MTLIVEIEAFLNEARRHAVDASTRETIVLICVPQPAAEQTNPEASPAITSPLHEGDDELITWEDAAWQ